MNDDQKIIVCFLLCTVGAFVGSFMALFCAFVARDATATLGMVPGGVIGAFAGMRLAKKSLNVKAHWVLFVFPPIVIGLLVGVGCFLWFLVDFAAGFKIRAPADR